jgi:HEAT repeat protein
VSDSAVPAPGDLPTDVLFRLARREVEDDDGDAPMPSLVALHRRPTREVFDRAATLVVDGEAAQRELGVRILGELGDEQTDGCRPFRDETVALMRARLRAETDPGVVGAIVSTLGRHRARDALSQVVALAGNPDARVRFPVAAALPSLVDLDRVEPGAAAALFRLGHDDDPDIRYYALYAATREIGGLDVPAVIRLVVQLTDDPDEQVRTMAVAHLDAIGVVRELLAGAFPPAEDTGAYDHLVGPILVTLACAGEAADARRWLAEEIRRHLGAAAVRCDPSDVADRLVAWWAAEESRRWT